MHEIAKGMEYLHAQGVLHGDLKASNVLVSDQRYRCLIADFGLSEMKSEAYRISGKFPARKSPPFLMTIKLLTKTTRLRWNPPMAIARNYDRTAPINL
jgi:serine/threonine protein kinase